MLNLSPPTMTVWGIAPPMPSEIRAKIAAHAAKALAKTSPPPLAAAAKPVARPAHQPSATGVAQVWIEQRMSDRKVTRGAAIHALAHEMPKLHSAWIAEVNHG